MTHASGTAPRLAGYLAAAERITVLSGAGLSRASEEDRRGPNGPWTVDSAAHRLFTLRDYLADPGIRREAWRIRREHATWSARPSRGHYALVELETTGKLRGIITQNIDGLHQLAGSSEELVVELQGSLYEVECLSCGARSAMSDTLERVAAGEEDPACLRCGGILKAGTSSLGQPVAAQVLEGARRATAECDVLLAIGTTLAARAVVELTDIALRAGAKLIILSSEPTRYDAAAVERVDAPIDVFLPELIHEAIGSLADRTSTDGDTAATRT